MAALGAVDVKSLDAGATITVRVNVTRQFRCRVFIAKCLISFAVFVLGCGVKIIEDGE